LADDERNTRRKPFVWVSTSYFAEGFPYMVVNELAVPLFKHLGAGLGAIGLTALFHLPWNLKFLWGHAVDGYETKRRWVLGAEALLAVAMVGFAFIATQPALIGPISAMFMVLAVLSATHDIAVDGFYLEALDDEGQSKFVGLRAMAYRLAMLSIAGPGLILISRFGWTASLFAMAAIMIVLLVVHGLILPSPEKRQKPLAELGKAVLSWRVLLAGALLAAAVVATRRLGFGDVVLRGITKWLNTALLLSLVALVALRGVIQRRIMASKSDFAKACQSFIAQPRIGFILGFIVCFRVGESLLIKMKLPFLMDDVGMTLEGYGVANGTVGLIASIAGTLVGGWLISKQGLRKWIWPFVVAQNLLNLLYVGLAYASGWGLGITFATVVIALERIGEGLGTAVFMVYLMRCCSPSHKAAHMAIATALMSVGYTVAGAYSGFIAEATGFRLYFLLSFFATFPAMLMIPFLPHLDHREPDQAEEPALRP
jgi:PAT family beta-lactamase induction signal transducer AmpG